MGTEARIVLYAPSLDAAERGASAAFSRMAELDATLSDYRNDSEISRLSLSAVSQPAPVGKDLATVLSAAIALSTETGGAFDVSAGPLVQLWRGARQVGSLPDEAILCEALGRVGWRNIELDSAAGTVQLKLSGMKLDVGGVAKGYAADEAISALKAHGIDRALVSIGGETVAGMAPPGERGWLIQLEHADSANREARLVNAAISTSGDTEQFIEIGGVRYSHVVDPRTGVGLTGRIAATVRAPTGIAADAWSTAVTVLDPVQRQAFIAGHPEGEFFVRALGSGPGYGAFAPRCPAPKR